MVEISDVQTGLRLHACEQLRDRATRYGLRVRAFELSTHYDVLLELDGIAAAGFEVDVVGSRVDVRVSSFSSDEPSGISLQFVTSIDAAQSSGDFSDGLLHLRLAKHLAMALN